MHTKPPVLTWVIVGAWLALAAPLTAGPAINQFEIKDLESDPGDMQFQSQNALSRGQPTRLYRPTAAGLAFDDNTVAQARYALELQRALTSWFRGRVGIEFERERLDDPGSLERADAFANLRLTGWAVEGVVVLKPVKSSGVGLGMLVEYDGAVGAGADTLTVGPIIEASAGPWSAIANLAVVQTTTSPDRKRDASYAIQLQYAIAPAWAIALEAYGTIDRIGQSGTPSTDSLAFGTFDQHRLGPVVYYRINPTGDKSSAEETSGPRHLRPSGHVLAAMADADDAAKVPSVSLGVGVLFGLNGATPDQTLKLSLEYNF